jgi:peptidoglycan/LPS O-acetylase OafA/YrhL
MNKYVKFGLMLLVSFVLMYAIMFLNADVFDHVMLSNTRTYMSLLMVAPMAISMLLFMWKMYDNKKLNYLILATATGAFFLTLYLLRQQVFISDVQWMKAMIPHHSSAIMVSQKADLKDPEAIQLAKEIIEAQKREIAQMEEMLRRIED